MLELDQWELLWNKLMWRLAAESSANRHVQPLPRKSQRMLEFSRIVD
jgi:hypothetical protein